MNAIEQAIRDAQDVLASSLCFAKTYDPRERAIQDAARTKLAELRAAYPVTYRRVCRGGMNL